MVHVAVHDIIGPMAPQQVRHEASENPGLAMVGTVEGAAAQRPEVAFQRPAAIAQHQGVHGEALPVDMPQQVQQPHLDPAAIEAADYVEDAALRRHRGRIWRSASVARARMGDSLRHRIGTISRSHSAPARRHPAKRINDCDAPSSGDGAIRPFDQI